MSTVVSRGCIARLVARAWWQYPLAKYNFLASWGQLDASFAVTRGPTNKKTCLIDREPMKKLLVYCWQQQDGKSTYVYSVIYHPPITNHS